MCDVLLQRRGILCGYLDIVCCFLCDVVWHGTGWGVTPLTVLDLVFFSLTGVPIRFDHLGVGV